MESWAKKSAGCAGSGAAIESAPDCTTAAKGGAKEVAGAAVEVACAWGAALAADFSGVCFAGLLGVALLLPGAATCAVGGGALGAAATVTSTATFTADVGAGALGAGGGGVACVGAAMVAPGAALAGPLSAPAAVPVDGSGAPNLKYTILLAPLSQVPITLPP